MLPFWSFSVLLLSSVLASPVNYNQTRNSTSECQGSSCNQTVNGSNHSTGCQGSSCNQTVNGSNHNLMAIGEACFLPTCAIHDLDKGLRPGDKKAGGAASDPFGPGKK